MDIQSAVGEAPSVSEGLYLNEYASLTDLTEGVDDYIEFYNKQRFHQTLEYKNHWMRMKKASQLIKH